MQGPLVEKMSQPEARQAAMDSTGGINPSFVTALASLLSRWSNRKALDTAASMSAKGALEILSRDDFLAEISRLLDRPCQRAISVLMVRVDQIQSIDHCYGEKASAAALAAAADRITSIVGAQSLRARLAGDFAIALSHPGAAAAPRKLAAAIRAAFEIPVILEGRPFQLSTSIGIATCWQCGLSAERLLRTAAIAMEEANKDGTRPVRIFHPQMETRLRERADLAAEMRAAIDAGQIYPVYQPVIDIATGQIEAFECLARWHHPIRGMIPPTLFIPIAECHGLIDRLMMRLLEQTCKDMQLWPAHVTLALNITPAQLYEPDLAHRLRQAMAEHGLDPQRLTIEITEQSLIGEMEAARGAIAVLRRNGFRVALDDFGTGYASLRYLSELQVDRIKIDRSFVAGLGEERGKHILRAILSLARGLRLQVIAEGVETIAQASLLRQMGCDHAQGYLFSHPVPSVDAAALSRQERVVPYGQRRIVQAA